MGGRLKMQHVFKQSNLNNFWQMIGSRGRGGKGEHRARKRQHERSENSVNTSIFHW